MEIFIIFDSAPESIEKSISRSGVCNCFDFGLSKRSGIVHIFSFVFELLWVFLLLLLLIFFVSFPLLYYWVKVLHNNLKEIDHGFDICENISVVHKY